ncbi:MAG TPA: hypothetical protein VG206_17560 [Terriglobia bacterium]|nr:hypothetical protein [Terriglobia bacterium]
MSNIDEQLERIAHVQKALDQTLAALVRHLAECKAQARQIGSSAEPVPKRAERRKRRKRRDERPEGGGKS